MATLGIAAAVGTVLPILWPNQIKEVKLIENIAGLSFATCFTAECFRRQRKEKTYQSIDEANYQIIKEGLRNTFVYEKAAQEINSKRELAAYVNRLPVEERGRWMGQYGLQGLVELPQVQQAVIEQPTQQPALKGSFNPSQSSFEQISDDLAVAIDYTWIDAPFVNSSKAVFGPKGSGKSVYLAYEAIAFLTHFPDGELRIGDKHFDEDESVWLPGVPADILLNQYVAKKPEQILKMFRRAKQLLDHRIENGIKSKHPECVPFKLICDEFEGFVMGLTDAEKSEVMNIIAQTQDEGRKYLINITLGMHSLKKERIGVDSSVLFQMDVLCLGSALADPNTKFPADFESKALLQKQMELQRTLKKSQGFACVVRKLGEMAKVEVIPFLDLSQFSFDVEPIQQQDTPQPTPQDNINPYQIIGDWIKQLGRNPTDSELVQAWQQVTGISLTADALTLLKNNLELTDEVVTWAMITADLELPEKWKEEDLQRAIAQRLTKHGYKAQTEVKSNGGFIDIATDFGGGTIVEIKKYLTRDTIYQSAGQLGVYGKGNEYKLLAVGFLPSNEGDIQQAKTTASMVENERIKVLFI
ncbi:MAG: hypothetical protein ACK53Q_11115 [Dolichospermum sp.]